MSNSDWITIWGIVATLLITIIGSALLLAFKIGGMAKTLQNVVEDVATLKVEVASIKFILGQLMIKIDVLWTEHLARSRSPIVPNEKGLHLLESSGIGVFADYHYPEIISRIRAANVQNAYQAQEALISIMNSYQNMDQHKLMLQDAAFLSGSDVNSLLFVAALSIRDRVILELGLARNIG